MSLFIMIKLLPLKYVNNPAAGYTLSEVPATIHVSASLIHLIDSESVS